MATTPNGLYYPLLSDAPNGPSQMQQLAQSADHKIIGSYATAAARTAAITSPTTGDVTYRADAGLLEQWNGTAWVPVDMQMFGTVAAVVGTAPAPNGALFKIQAGTVSVNTNASALASFNFPVAFPNGVLAVMLTAMNDTYPELRLVGSGGTTASACQVVVRTNVGAAAVSISGIQIAFLAIGW